MEQCVAVGYSPVVVEESEGEHNPVSREGRHIPGAGFRIADEDVQSRLGADQWRRSISKSGG